MDRNESPCTYCSEPTCYYGGCSHLPQPCEHEEYEQRLLVAFSRRAARAHKAGDHGAGTAWESAYDMLKYLLDGNYDCLEQFLAQTEE